MQVSKFMYIYVFLFQTGERPYACPYCKFRSADKNSLNKHIKRHTGEKGFYCKFCDFSTIQAVNLGYHYNSTHTEQALQQGVLFKCVSTDMGTPI